MCFSALSVRTMLACISHSLCVENVHKRLNVYFLFFLHFRFLTFIMSMSHMFGGLYDDFRFENPERSLAWKFWYFRNVVKILILPTWLSGMFTTVFNETSHRFHVRSAALLAKIDAVCTTRICLFWSSYALFKLS